MADPGARAPLTRYGWVIRATTPPSRSAASRTASRSGAFTSPPAPWVSASRKAGRAAPASMTALAGPYVVPISTAGSRFPRARLRARLMQRSQPGGQGLQVRRGEPGLSQAAGLGTERVVVAVDDHLRVGGQPRQPT